MKKIVLSSVVLLLLGATAMAQTATKKVKPGLKTTMTTNVQANDLEKKNRKTPTVVAPRAVVSDAAMTVESEAARKKAIKTSNK